MQRDRAVRRHEPRLKALQLVEDPEPRRLDQWRVPDLNGGQDEHQKQADHWSTIMGWRHKAEAGFTLTGQSVGHQAALAMASWVPRSGRKPSTPKAPLAPRGNQCDIDGEPQIREAACWAHLRRDFHDHLEEHGSE